MNFATLQGLTIPEGVVTQIADASGRVLWAIQQNNTPIIIEVEKITSNTYVSSTLYTGEQFILLDIYPKTSSSTVKVTYGSLTKTLTFFGTNAQQVYFGTFGGVTDGVTTPASGTLTIEGDCVAFGCGGYKQSSDSKAATVYCSCITAINEWGAVTNIPPYAFSDCTKLVDVTIPESVSNIGDSAFHNACGTSAHFTMLPTTPPTIGTKAFWTSSYVTFTVPKGCGEAYKTAENWTEYADRITEAS